MYLLVLRLPYELRLDILTKIYAITLHISNGQCHFCTQNKLLGEFLFFLESSDLSHLCFTTRQQLHQPLDLLKQQQAAAAVLMNVGHVIRVGWMKTLN